MTTRELFFYVIRKANKRHLLPEERREELGVEAVDGVGGVGGVVEAQHAKEVVQHENRGQIERLDVLQLDQQLQEALADPQAPIEEERPELRDVREQNLVDQPVVQQLEESLRFYCRSFRPTRRHNSRTSTCASCIKCVVTCSRIIDVTDTGSNSK